MKCKFNETKECIHVELFDKWKDNKWELAWLTIGICPDCPIYKEGIDSEEVKDAVTQPNKKGS